jgi:flagellar hook-associated protein 1 FlgK
LITALAEEARFAAQAAARGENVMSLQVARSIAYSSLMTTQVQLGVTSANIANAATDGYTTKTATQVATVTTGVGTGVTVTGIASAVDKLLMKSLVKATSSLGAATTTQSYADQLQSLLGSTTGGSDDTGTSLANTLSSMETALSQLAQTPESETLKAQAVGALDNVVSQLRSTSAGVQTLRADADSSIEAAVGKVNDNLATIGSLNKQVAATQARGESTADLEDQRATALKAVAEQMGVSYYVNSNNQLNVYTTAGQALVDSSVHKLSYASAATVTAATTYSATPPSGLSPITLDGVDITAKITSGAIGSLIDQRDSVLPAMQSELDTLASALVTTLNGIHNAGTAVPAPTSLTGTASVSAATALSGSGTLRIAVTDTDGKAVAYQDLDLSQYSTVGDLVSAMDGISGVSASIDASGHLVVASDSSDDGVSIGGTGTLDSQSASAYFGLNDLLTGSDATDIRVRSDILSTPSLLALGSLDATTTLAIGDTAIASGSTTVADALYAAVTGDVSFSAAGGLGAKQTSFAGYATDIVGLIATAAASADTNQTTQKSAQSTLAASMSSQTGVNIDEQTARLTDLQNAYSAASQLMKTINDMFTTFLDVVKAS